MSPLHDYEIDVGSIRAKKKKTTKNKLCFNLTGKIYSKNKADELRPL